MTERAEVGAEIARLTNDQLRTRTQGCTELSCLYHGAFNVALMNRHDCATCPDCIHHGNRCCGCYDGACCREGNLISPPGQPT